MKTQAGRQSPTARTTIRNAPYYLTSFVGREQDLRELNSSIITSRLVTLTGPGGAGKTRLALELVTQAPDLWQAGAWWVDLAAVTDPAQVPGVVSAVLELPARQPALENVVSWVADRRIVLVLDNCEHLVGACAEFCSQALERCPEMTIIVTSRETLGVQGEERWAVGSLPTADATRLFESRGRLILRDFAITDSNADVVSEICQRLDRLPFAIELAAARLDMLTEREILDQLENRFELLTSAARTGPQRHSTLMATVDWSFRLLNPQAATLLRRLSVFRGGFTLKGAEAVCGDGLSTVMLEILAELVRKSMVEVERLNKSSTRYHMLESVREFGKKKLREAGESDIVSRNHYNYFLAGVSSRSLYWTGLRPQSEPEGLEARQWKARETANLWAALRWARDHVADMGLALAIDMQTIPVGDPARARTVLLDLLERSPDTGRTRALALWIASAGARHAGDLDRAFMLAQAGVDLARQIGDANLVALGLSSLANSHQERGDTARATKLNDEALSLAVTVGNKLLEIGINNNEASNAIVRGDYATARAIFMDAVAFSRSIRDLDGIAVHLEGLALALMGLELPQAAADCLKESLTISYELDIRHSMVACIVGLSRTATAARDDRRAVRLAAIAACLGAAWSQRLDNWYDDQLAQSQRRSGSRLGQPSYEQAWNEGWAIGPDQGIDYALGKDDLAESSDLAPLSRREQDVARLIATGMTNREIARRLFIAERTAESHAEHIRTKLGVRSRTEVATWAVGRRLAPAPPGGVSGGDKKRGSTSDPPRPNSPDLS